MWALLPTHLLVKQQQEQSWQPVLSDQLLCIVNPIWDLSGTIPWSHYQPFPLTQVKQVLVWHSFHKGTRRRNLPKVTLLVSPVLQEATPQDCPSGWGQRQAAYATHSIPDRSHHRKGLVVWGLLVHLPQ